MQRKKLVFDIEVAPDYFLVGFKGIDTGMLRQYEMFDGQHFNRAEVLQILSQFTVIGFNSEDYDIPVLFYALLLTANPFHDIGQVLGQIKTLSDQIIASGMRGWQVQQEYGFQLPAYLDHIDLKEPVPGVQISLKLYGGRLHSKRLQDLPYHHDEPVFGWPEDRRSVILSYNGNDLDTTIDLWREATKPSDNIIETRELLSKEFGVDLRSKSDAQIAEAAIKTTVAKLKGGPVYRQEVRPGTSYRYKPPAFLRFDSPVMQQVFATVLASRFVVDDKGSVQMPPALADLDVAIGGSVYRMGIGGLHSTEKSVARVANAGVGLFDRDVVSYYPSLILQCGLFPANMGDHFQQVYRSFYERRLAAKKAGNKSVAQTLKIILNGTFGKLGSRWSVLYAPDLMIQVTITGQLALLMLIERMEAAGIPVVSANTDGIVMACPLHLQNMMHAIVFQWELDTGLETEETCYRAVYSRDVNSYLAIKTDGKTKVKGALAASDAQHNPSEEIVKTAVVNYLAKGVPIEETILNCTDIRQFLTVQRVTGGAQMPTATKTVDEWIEVEPRVWKMKVRGKVLTERRKSRPRPVVATDTANYLGKVVRWYRSVLSNEHIEYVKNGNKVSGSDNAKPLMTLPDHFPNDVDHVYYVQQAYTMLRDFGAL